MFQILIFELGLNFEESNYGSRRALWTRDHRTQIVKAGINY